MNFRMQKIMISSHSVTGSQAVCFRGNGGKEARPGISQAGSRAIASQWQRKGFDRISFLALAQTAIA